ncbi:MAG: carbon-monoxide dehydrogenase [Herbaspirillum sp.]|jgi:carbon-monoxide dehydrogenase large subunit|nr:carbon-monoxide dehydrogenase [Herbaspirillum sp.]
MNAPETKLHGGASTGALIGQPMERVEDAALLTGRAIFVDDLHRPDMLHAAVLRSPMAHGRIAGLDIGAARAAPGVHAVFTAADIARGGLDIPIIRPRLADVPQYRPYLQPVIASDKVRYVGEPIALVIADSRALAEDALELIGLDIEPLPAIPDCAAAEANATLLFEASGSNVAWRYTSVLGAPERVFDNADYVRTETFRSQRQTAVTLETRGLLAQWDAAAQHMTVHGAAKAAFFNRKMLAAMLGLPPEQVDLIEVSVGGGFGVRGEFYPEDFLIPFAARQLQRPVKWIEDRREHLMATNHSRQADCELTIACARDGTILGLRGRVFTDMGAYIRTGGGVVPAKTLQFLHGPYRIPAFEIEVASIMTSKTPVGTYRGPGNVEATFFRERMIDIAARELKIDPIALRRKNLIPHAELPYSLGHLVPFEGEAVLDTGDYHAAFERCIAEIGWTDIFQQQGRLIDGRRHGAGIACFIEDSGGAPRENAKASLDAHGTFTVAVGSSAIGQGIATGLTQVAAETLGVAPHRVRVLHGSTTLLAEGFGSYHSRSATMGGCAVLDATQKLRALLLDAAARHFHCPGSALLVSDDGVTAPGGALLSWQELAGVAAHHGIALSAEGTFFNQYHTFGYGSHAAHVAVDPKTGQVEVLDYVAVDDVGRILNPMLVHGQLIGAIVQGLGGVFLDHLVYDDQAQLLNASLADYLLPTATDFPNVRGVTLASHPALSNPLGVKGAGEGGILAVAAAVGNAVSAALGVDVTELPLSPSRVWALAEQARIRAHASKGEMP